MHNITVLIAFDKDDYLINYSLVYFAMLSFTMTIFIDSNSYNYVKVIHIHFKRSFDYFALIPKLVQMVFKVLSKILLMVLLELLPRVQTKVVSKVVLPKVKQLYYCLKFNYRYFSLILNYQTSYQHLKPN